MNVSIEYRPEIRSMFLEPVGKVLSDARVMVLSDDCTIYEAFMPTRIGYKQACRFARLLELGYSPDAARWLSRYGQINKHDFELEFDPSAHTEFPVPFIPDTCIAIEDIMVTGELTPGEIENLYRLWLQDGDEIFHFGTEYTYGVDIPALLSDFRALAQGQDDLTGDWTHSHHSDVILY